MKVDKVLNNSLVLSVNDDNKEVIVMGKGIGFDSKPGDSIAAGRIEKVFVVQQQHGWPGYIHSLQSIPENIIEMVVLILAQANQQLESKVREQIFFTLADHLNFAIERCQKGIVIENRLLHEVKRFYAPQFKVALQALGEINQKYGLSLPEEEAGNIAFHLVNGQSAGDNVSQTMQSVKIMKDIFNIVQYHFVMEIDTESVNYSRFMIHMQFFIQRLLDGDLKTSRDSFLLVQVIKEYPEAYKCTLLIRDYIKSLLDITLSGDELLWLTVHLARVTQNEQE